MNDRKAPPETGSDETAKRLVFAHAELLGAKGEHRRKTRFEVEAALLDLTEVRDELCRDFALPGDETPDSRKQVAVRNVREIHVLAHTMRVFGPLSDAR
jgi:hypothetical protein